MSKRTVLAAALAAAFAVATAALVPAGAGASEKGVLAEATKLTLTSNRTVVNHAGAAVLTGSLVTSETGTPVASETVVLEKSLDASAHWSRVATLTTDASGTCVATCTLAQNTRYRARYPGDGHYYEPAYSYGLNVGCRAAIYAPLVSPSVPRVGRTVTFSGLVRPRHASSMIMYLYQYSGGRWVLRRTRMVLLRPVAGTGLSKWVYVTSIPSRGWWTVRARHRDVTHSDSYRDRVFTVRP